MKNRVFVQNVVGVICHADGAITNGEKSLALTLPASIRGLDQSIMNNAIDFHSHSDTGAIVVVGANTYDELQNTAMMRQMKKRVLGFVVSSDKNIMYYSADGVKNIELVSFGETDTKEQKKTILRRTVFAMLYNVDPEAKVSAGTAIIIGGVSVYEAFTGFYTYFHECKYLASVESEKRVDVSNIVKNIIDSAKTVSNEKTGLVAYSDEDYRYTVWSV